MAINLNQFRNVVNSVKAESPLEQMVKLGLKDPSQFDWEAYGKSWLLFSIETNLDKLVNALENIQHLPEQLLFKLAPLAASNLQMLVNRIQTADTLFVKNKTCERLNAYLDLLERLSPEKQDEVNQWAERAAKIRFNRELEENEQAAAQSSGLI